jgi:alanine dehydrogenase
MRYWTERDVAAAAPLADVIDAVERVLEHQAAGTAHNIDKTMATWPEASSAHALGAFDGEDGLVVFKTWVNTPAGAGAQLTAFSAVDGRVLAVMEAGTAGALRTAAVSGLATRWMSAPDADELAVLGAGRQALRQVAAVAAVRRLRRVRVWSRSAERRGVLADAVTAELGVPAEAMPSVSAATRDAPIVTLITRATEPFLRAEHLADGAHLNAVGAILPANAEFDSALLGSSALTVIDSEPNARRGSREFNEYFGDDWSAVRSLADVVTGKVARPDRPRCTVFKGMGMGLSDLAVAGLLLGRSHNEGGAR